MIKRFILERNKLVCLMLLKAEARILIAREVIVLEVIKNTKDKFIKNYMIIFMILH